MAPRPCLVCGTPTARTRCPAHQLRPDPAQQVDRGYGRQHRAITARVVARWVSEHGWVCPGWQIPAHPVPPGGLEGEHVIPRSVRPDLALDPSNYSVLCRVCNARKGSRTD